MRAGFAENRYTIEKKELAKEIVVKGTAFLGELSFTIETEDEED